jgi:hypothetical protein
MNRKHDHADAAPEILTVTRNDTGTEIRNGSFVPLNTKVTIKGKCPSSASARSLELVNKYSEPEGLIVRIEIAPHVSEFTFESIGVSTEKQWAQRFFFVKDGTTQEESDEWVVNFGRFQNLTSATEKLHESVSPHS